MERRSAAESFYFFFSFRYANWIGTKEITSEGIDWVEAKVFSWLFSRRLLRNFPDCLDDIFGMLWCRNDSDTYVSWYDGRETMTMDDQRKKKRPWKSRSAADGRLAKVERLHNWLWSAHGRFSPNPTNVAAFLPRRFFRVSTGEKKVRAENTRKKKQKQIPKVNSGDGRRIKSESTFRWFVCLCVCVCVSVCGGPSSSCFFEYKGQMGLVLWWRSFSSLCVYCLFSRVSFVWSWRREGGGCSPFRKCNAGVKSNADGTCAFHPLGTPRLQILPRCY